jgi:hypothetical protein
VFVLGKQAKKKFSYLSEARDAMKSALPAGGQGCADCDPRWQNGVARRTLQKWIERRCHTQKGLLLKSRNAHIQQIWAAGPSETDTTSKLRNA